MKIVIEVDMDDLSSGLNQMVDVMDLEEDDDFECPDPLRDPDLNADNRAMAVDNYSYGPSVDSWEKKKEKCGICEYFNITQNIMRCIEDGLGDSKGKGFCSKLDFACNEENTCDAFEGGGPITDYEEDDMEPMPGGSRDIM